MNDSTQPGSTQTGNNQTTSTLHLVRVEERGQFTGLSEDDRTFFALPRHLSGDDRLTMFVPNSDPRHGYLSPILDSAERFLSLGLTPSEFSVRPIQNQHVEILHTWEDWRAGSDMSDPEFSLSVGQWATWGSRDYWYRIAAMDRNSAGVVTVAMDASVNPSLPAFTDLPHHPIHDLRHIKAYEPDVRDEKDLPTAVLTLIPVAYRQARQAEAASDVTAGVPHEYRVQANHDAALVEEAQPEFKVGDRVRIVEAYHDNAHNCVGREGTLTRTDSRGVYGNVPHPYHVRVTEGDAPNEYGAAVIERVEQNQPEVKQTQPEFKVGDCVRIVEAHNLNSRKIIGDLHRVMTEPRMVGGQPHYYEIVNTWDEDAEEERGYWMAMKIEHVEPVEPQPSAYQEAERALAKAREDITKMAEALKQEAVDRGWCSEYEDFIERVNPTLSEPRFEPRRKTYEVIVEVRLDYVASDGPRAQDTAVAEIRDALSDLLNAPNSVRATGSNRLR